LGGNFFKSKHIGRLFAHIFRDFAHIFRDFAKVFTDFAQISTDFAQISTGFARIFRDFARIFTKSELLGVRLHPASYTTGYASPKPDKFKKVIEVFATIKNDHYSIETTYSKNNTTRNPILGTITKISKFYTHSLRVL